MPANDGVFYTVRLNIKRIQAEEKFIDESFNAVIDDIDQKILGIGHLSTGMHWTPWESGTSYMAGDVIRWPRLKSHQYAKCIQGGTTSANVPIVNTTGSEVTNGSTKWKIMSLTEVSDVIGGTLRIWLGGGTLYERGDAVIYGKSIYRCRTASHYSSLSFGDDIDNWQEVFASIRFWQPLTYYEINDTVIVDGYIHICLASHTSASTYNLAEKNNWQRMHEYALVPEWEPSTRYLENQVVTIDSILYVCTYDHTSDVSDVDVDEAYWNPLYASLQNWTTGSFYGVGVTILHDNCIYKCTIEHVASLNFDDDSANWVLLHQLPSKLYDWGANIKYDQYQLVYHENNIYRALYAHTSGSIFDTTKWQVVSDSINDWVSQGDYQVGQYVNYQGSLYKCITNNNDTNFTIAKWQKVSGGSLETWTSNKDYSVGDVVINGGKIYQCNTAHTSSSSFNTDTNNWTEISACITRIPNWAVSTEYVVGDLVAHDAKIYRCITAHTSDSTQWNAVEEAKWEELSPTINEISSWAVSTDYAVGQLVIHDNKLYRCNTAHTSDSTSFNTDIAYWDVIGSSGIDSWKTGELYQQGSMVVYNDKIYVCDTAHTSANPFDYTKWHEVSSTTIEDWQANTEYVENQPIEYNDTLFRANKDFTSGTTVSDDDNNLDFVYANLSIWKSGIYYREGSIVIDSDDKIYKCKQSHISSLANRDTNWEELSKTLVEEYAQNKNYAEGAPVVYNGKLYRANTDVTNSTAALDPNKWDNIVGSGIEQWQSSTDYSVGNVVINNNQIYICTTAHTSDSTAFNTDIANWGLLDTKWKSENWSANTLYTANEVVLYDNRLFRCVSTHTSAVDFATDANYWLAIGSRLEVWKQNVHYKVEDVIINNNKLYRCITEHTSTTTFDGTKWNEISPATIELWQTSTDYRVGDIVVKDNQLFRCIIVHTSDSSNFNNDINNWQLLDIKWIANNWTSNTLYVSGEVALYNNTPIKCTTTHVSSSTYELDKDNWETLSANIREWVSGNTYKVGDTVIYENEIWKCITANNGDAFEKDKWERINKCNIEMWRGAPDPDTLLLCHFDNTDKSTYDEYGHDITSTAGEGYPWISSAIPKFGSHCIYVGGGPGMSTPTYEFTSGTEIYTVEFWASDQFSLYGREGLRIGDEVRTATGGGNIGVQVGDVSFSSSKDRNWHHLAFIIDNNYIRAYLDGIQQCNESRVVSGQSFSIWYARNQYQPGDSRESCVDELRVSSIDRYSANFIPQTEAFSNPNYDGYKVDDLVVYEDKIYRCIEDNNDAIFTPLKWVEVSSANTPLWETNTYYAVGDIVIYNNQTYRCTMAHTSNTFLGDIAKWQSLDINWFVKSWESNKLYLEDQAVYYDDSLWKCLATHESTTDDSPADAVLYESSTNVIDIDNTTTIPYSEIIDLGSVKKVTDFTYNEVTTDMSFTYNIETSTDGVTYTPWTATKTNARYVKLTVDSVNIATGATSPSAYLDDFAVVGESDKWEKISSGGADIELARRSDIDEMFI